MRKLEKQPAITVGLVTSAREIQFRLMGEFELPDLTTWSTGEYKASVEGGRLTIHTSAGEFVCSDSQTELRPIHPETARFMILDVTIGIGFHWERKQDQTFQGIMKLEARPPDALLVINRVPLEAYVTSVIASEMSANSPSELLKAHAVISRSWLLAQLSPWKVFRKSTAERGTRTDAGGEHPLDILRWYSRTEHTDFDVCADDHCQRYQGVTKAGSPAVHQSISETHGLLLTYRDEVCDARFSKCCGGMTEDYGTAWEDVEIPYLTGVPDGPGPAENFDLDFYREENVRRWMLESPPAFCNTSDDSVLRATLPDFDQETRDFYRWTVPYPQEEVQELLRSRLDLDLGAILRFEPIERGVSGRIIRLRIVGERDATVIGKELEIRRALSRSHLYSSAFLVEAEGTGKIPERFTLHGAGWGHGVGLCQIGAAVMASQGRNYRQILGHYYRGANLFQLYE